MLASSPALPSYPVATASHHSCRYPALTHLRYCYCCHAHRRLKRLVGVRLRHLGLGYWHRDGVSKRLNISEPGLELWRTKITRGARIVWQVGLQELPALQLVPAPCVLYWCYGSVA